MAGLDHVPPPPESESEHAIARRMRYGRVLFILYLVLYAGFVLLNAFDPTVMERTPFAGVNLAILYGLGLIFAAFGLGVLYGWLCREKKS